MSITPRTLGLLTSALLVLCAAGAWAGRPATRGEAGANPHPVAAAPSTPGDTYRKPPTSELQRRLTPLQFDVTQRGATEPPFQNAYWDHHDAGLYVDVVTGEPIFSSRDKFDSRTGWPSFTRPLEAGRVVERSDSSHGLTRTEVRSRAGDSHLGHVFADGPPPGGLRYCINSAALRFVPAAMLQGEGYGAYVPLFAHNVPATRETAILAGGCFWGMEEILRSIPGVIDTEVGYTGDAEAVRVVFDPRTLTYEELLERWFFRMHDPTTPNRQGNDVGAQYRSAIFVTSAAQRATAEAVRARIARSGKWDRPVVTEISEAGPFTPAEESHQDYLQKHPGGYTCHYLRD